MKLGIAFSGGKDSLACLYLNEPRWDELTVIWVNTGKNYPETLSIIDNVRPLCKSFIEVIVDRDEQNYLEGLPSEIVPIDFTSLGQGFTGTKPVKVQSYLGCCYENISKHIHSTAKDLGITHLIKGQRLDETHISTSRNNDVFDGITLLQPIEGWTKQEVLGYLATKMELPEHLYFNHSSLDCYDCTAYLSETKDVNAWAKNNHPDLNEKKIFRLNQLKTVITPIYKELQEIS